MDGIVRRGLVGNDIGTNAATDEFREDFRRIADQADGFRLARLGPLVDQRQRLIERMRLRIDITGAQAEIDAGFIAFDGKAAGAGHDGGERLCATHAAETAGENPLALQVAFIMLAAGLDKGFIGTLHDALRTDIDPRTGRHLAVHGKALLIQLVEMIPVRPVRHEVGIGDQDARRVLMGAEHADRLAGLHDEGFILVQILQRRDDTVEIVPGAGGAADAAINHQLMRALGHVRVEIVHQHAQRRFRHPAFGIEVSALRRADITNIVAWIVHVSSPYRFVSNANFSMRVRMVLRWERSRSALPVS
jgi:hypothetical protein